MLRESLGDGGQRRAPDASARWKRHFFVATPGPPARLGNTDRRGAKGILAIGYDPDQHRLFGVPHTFASYRGDGQPAVVGLAFGPDGLYFVPLLPQSHGRAPCGRCDSTPPTHTPTSWPTCGTRWESSGARSASDATPWECDARGKSARPWIGTRW